MKAGSTGRRAAIAVLLVCAVLATAVGGYLVGHSSGEDLEAARSKGEASGRLAGAKQGAKHGRAVGRPAGFKAGYESA